MGVVDFFFVFGMDGTLTTKVPSRNQIPTMHNAIVSGKN